MKAIQSILILLLLIGCNGTATTSTISNSTQDSPTNDRWHFKKYLDDPTTPRLAKLIFNDSALALYKGDILGTLLTFLDSLKAKNIESRPFYFKVVTKTIPKSDASYGEALTGTAKNYVLSNTKEFLNYFTGDNPFLRPELNDWADIVSADLNLVYENEDTAIAEKTIQQLKVNCGDCSDKQKEILSIFTTELGKELRAMKEASAKRKEDDNK